MPTASSSSLPDAKDRLLWVPLAHLHPHPANANWMPPELHVKLAANITATGGYQPLAVRPHPHLAGEYQLLNGEQRRQALLSLGHTEALCFLWPCDDTTALLLIAALNRLEGEDIPVKRAELLAQLNALLPVDDLGRLLPETPEAITETLALIDLDTEALLAELAAAQVHDATVPRVVSFALLPEDEAAVEEAVARASEGLNGGGRRGRALALICRAYLGRSDA